MPILGPGTTIFVQPPSSPTIVLAPPVPAGVFVVVQRGPQGPPGAVGSGTVYVQAAPAATWTVNTSLGRRPYSVMLLDNAGNEFFSDVSCPSMSQIVVTHATAQTGSVSYT